MVQVLYADGMPVERCPYKMTLEKLAKKFDCDKLYLHYNDLETPFDMSKRFDYTGKWHWVEVGFDGGILYNGTEEVFATEDLFNEVA